MIQATLLIFKSKEEFVRNKKLAEYRLRKSIVTLGRGKDARIKLQGDNISRIHSTIIFNNSIRGHVIFDGIMGGRNSSNGLFLLEGDRNKPKQIFSYKLENNDVLKIDGYYLRYKIQAQSTQSKAGYDESKETFSEKPRSFKSTLLPNSSFRRDWVSTFRNFFIP